MIRRVMIGLFVMLVAVTGSHAQSNKGPYEVVTDTTQELLKVIEEAKSYISDDEPRFVNEILQIMDRVVDFQSFARGVMGDYGSSQTYRALKTDAEREAFRQRVFRFTETFRNGLINTYAKGLLAFNGNRIEVLPELVIAAPGGVKTVSVQDVNAAELNGTVSVRQHIYGERAAPYEVIYSMSKDRDGHWKLRNVIIEGLNLGQIYQSQFVAAVKTEQGNIDKVIDNWTVTPNAVSDQQAAAGQ